MILSEADGPKDQSADGKEQFAWHEGRPPWGIASLIGLRRRTVKAARNG